MMTTSRKRSPRQQGFTLVEALIALLVMSFGMLALSGMQLSLSHNADVAKQRTEAVRLAEERIERMRSFVGIATGTGAIVWDTLSTTAETVANGGTVNGATYATNTTYTVTPTLGGTPSDPMRPISVTVAWADRTSSAANQSVTVSSVISKTDPTDPGFIGNPLPLNTPLKRPKNRNINIPIPALDLGGGQSSTQFDANYVIVYSNITAGIVKICNPGVANATAAQINQSIAGTLGSCVDVTGYILAGYIGRTGTSLAWPTGIKHDVVGAEGIVRNTPFTTPSTQATRCLFSDATNQNTGSVITADNGYKYYICVVPLNAPYLWSGTVRLGGLPTTSNLIVCRYEYTQTALTVNERNIQPYVNVDRSMDQQNYLVATSSSNVSSSLRNSTTACPSAMTVTGVSVGVVHQDCRLANSARATECTAPTP